MGIFSSLGSAAAGAIGSGAGIMAGISSQGRSGFQSNVMTKLDSIESKLSSGGGGGGAMPVEQPPVLPPGNLGGNLAQPDPVAGDAGGVGFAGLPLPGGRPEIGMGGDMDPIADANVNEQFQMPQGRSYI
jgi:hypothetical protein|tara:strand:- start:39 stop:428 length:390 start_codon:yes stop_codon:yes gene_type:complete